MLILKTYFRSYTWKIYIKDLSNFVAVNNSIFTFSQYSMVSISKLLIGKERRYSTPESSILLGTVVLKIFCNSIVSSYSSVDLARANWWSSLVKNNCENRFLTTCHSQLRVYEIYIYIQCKPDISRLVGSMERYLDISESAIYRAASSDLEIRDVIGPFMGDNGDGYKTAPI